MKAALRQLILPTHCTRLLFLVAINPLAASDSDAGNHNSANNLKNDYPDTLFPAITAFKCVASYIAIAVHYVLLVAIKSALGGGGIMSSA